MKQHENNQNEMEQERVSYLHNLDDMNYAILAEPLDIRNESAMTPNSYVGVLGEINLVNGLIYTEDKDIMEIIESQSQIDSPARKFQPLRPAVLKYELPEDPYSE